MHNLLGTPSDERLLAMLEALADRDSAAVLTLLDQAAGEGVQPSDLLAGTLEFLRDAMVLAVGAEPALLAVSPRQKPRLQDIVNRWPIDTILAALQILAEARSRMRGVSHARLLAELALVRIARLENLSDLSNMVQRLAAIESGSPLPHKTEAVGVKKKLTPPEPQPIARLAAAEASPSTWICRRDRLTGAAGRPVDGTRGHRCRQGRRCHPTEARAGIRRGI